MGSQILTQLLPKLQKFFGVLPLYIGVEVILGYAIINKMSGLFGLLSLFTGHPINFLQWLFYLASFIITPFYVLGMLSLRKPRARLMALISVVYAIDTIGGIFFTVYFAYLWFSEAPAVSAPDAVDRVRRSYNPEEDVAALGPVDKTWVWNKDAIKVAEDYIILPLVSRGEDLSSQSASKGYELFITVASSIGVSVLRIYFTLVVLSFTKQLMKASKYTNEDSRLTTSKIDQVLTALELRSTRLLTRMFSY